ncbi:4830_t:CDS:2 [Paraglomus occultum]|uniref:4830_t:CDS:1 n=1 Tax=Paraglomus occultum TaxID=144539 RepID=A0A9N8WLS6_9GLOM|nr:4830_t:CDS:2 [Paraglomus occultum]
MTDLKTLYEETVLQCLRSGGIRANYYGEGDNGGVDFIVTYERVLFIVLCNYDERPAEPNFVDRMTRKLTEYPMNTVGILVAPQFSERAECLASSSICNIILTEATDIASNIIQYVESLEQDQESDSEDDAQFNVFVLTKQTEPVQCTAGSLQTQNQSILLELVLMKSIYQSITLKVLNSRKAKARKGASPSLRD